MDNETVPLIQTKLNRPPVPIDLVARPQLIQRLEKQRRRPLSLVSAPAGYGKSTLVSSWLETVEGLTAWLSLDEQDNDLEVFLGYFIAAIQQIYPESLKTMQAMLSAPELPPQRALTTSLMNELNEIAGSMILVLDDYHLIHEMDIHDLLNDLLLHPPQVLHLVICTRADPLINLTRLRAQSQVTEIRVSDLRFTKDEASILLSNLLGQTVDDATVMELEASSEGWVTGLRLAALAMRHRVGLAQVKGDITIDNRYVADYLMAEILANQTAGLSECLLKTSILNRFNAEIIEAVCFRNSRGMGLTEIEPEDRDLCGESFVGWLRSTNLFVIPLDDHGEWFRYHHLFRDFLLGELNNRMDTEAISALHISASDWFAQAGFIEESMDHAIIAGEVAKAIEVVSGNRYALMNEAKWSRLQRWLDRFPTEVIEHTPELLTLNMWLTYHHGHYNELPTVLAQLKTTIEQSSLEIDMFAHLKGEISAVQSLLSYIAADSEGTIKAAKQSIEQTPEEVWIVRIFARLCMAVAYQMKGDLKNAYKALYDGFDHEQVKTNPFKATLLVELCTIYCIAADLNGLAQSARQCQQLSVEPYSPEFRGWGHYYLARVHYQQNDLRSAEEHFAAAVRRPHLLYGNCYANSACGLALTYQAQGRQDEARQALEAAHVHMIETGNMTLLPMIQAFQAELMIQQNHIGAANKWAARLDPIPPFKPEWSIISPNLTLVKAWLAQNTPVHRKQAHELLTQLDAFYDSIHNTRFLIEVLVLRALLHDLEDQDKAAQSTLEEALILAEPSGFIRLFVDQGPRIAELMRKLSGSRSNKAYIAQILAAFSSARPALSSVDQGQLIEPLTERELEVLALLAKRRTNKEIAAELVISPGTVKQHAHNIYQKMNVKGRRHAVREAIELGILTPE